METLGSLVDKLITVDMKLWRQEEIAQDPRADDHTIATAKKKISLLNLQRNSLIQEIDELQYDISQGKPVPVFPQLKDYQKR
jgi:cell division protein FtsB